MHCFGYCIFIPHQIRSESCKIPESVQYAGAAGRQRERPDRYHACLYQKEHDSQEHTIACVWHDQLRIDPIIVSFTKVLRFPVPWRFPQNTHIFLCLIQVSFHRRKQREKRRQRRMASARLCVKLIKVASTGPQRGHMKRLPCKLIQDGFQQASLFTRLFHYTDQFFLRARIYHIFFHGFHPICFPVLLAESSLVIIIHSTQFV